MSTLIQSVQEKLTRSIEEVLYQALLKYGFTPNRDTLLGNKPGYLNKQAEIKDRKGFCIELFGHGSPADRDNKYVPRIVITGQGFYQGSLGNDSQIFFEKNAKGTYDKLEGPLKSSNFRFEIELVSNKTSQDNTLEAIRSEAIPDFTHIPVYNSLGESFLVRYGGIRNIPDFANGLIRKIYTYEAVDVFERLNRTIGEIVPIKEITVTDKIDNTIINKVPTK